MVRLVLRHLPLEHVHRAHEIRDEAVARVFIKVARRIHLDQAPLVHDADAVAQRHRLLLVMGDHDEGGAEGLLDVHQLELGLLAQLLVERAEGFVQQQRLGLLGQRARQRHALTLPARELAGAALGEGRQLHQVEHPGDLRRDLTLRHPVLLQSVGDVLLNAHVGEEGVGLEHHVHRPLPRGHRGHVLAVDLDRAAVRPLEPREHPQEGGLARAGAAEEAEDLPLPHVEAQVVDGPVAVEALGQVRDADEGAARPGAALGPAAHARSPPGAAITGRS